MGTFLVSWQTGTDLIGAVAAAFRHPIFDRSEIALQKLPRTEAFGARSSSLRAFHERMCRTRQALTTARWRSSSPISMRSKMG